MTPQESIEIITNAIQTDNMTAEQDKALAIVQKALEKQIHSLESVENDKSLIVKACHKYREQIRALKEQLNIIESNMGNLLVQREEDNQYYRKRDELYIKQEEQIKQIIEINGVMAGKLSLYERAEHSASITEVQAEK